MSRPIEDLAADTRLAAVGVTEVTLLGQNVNSFGRDLTHRRPLFAELLRRVGAVEGIRRVRYTSPHPKDLCPETIAAMTEVPAVCEHLHYPLQSGSDRILADMQRLTPERRPGQGSTSMRQKPQSAMCVDSQPSGDNRRDPTPWTTCG